MRSVRLLLALLLLTSCGETGIEVIAGSLTGLWSGGTGSVGLTLDLVQQGSGVVGAGSVQSADSIVSVAVTGTNQGNRVALTLQASGGRTGTFSGSFLDGSTVGGSLTFPGLPGGNMAMHRQGGF